MMRWLIGSSLQFRLLVAVIAAVVLFFGITQVRDMPVDILPEFSRPYVEIQTEALGLSAEEVEAMITTPLEADMLNGAPWVDEIRSESISGLSSIKLYFEPGTDMLDARQVIQERLVQAYALPSVSKPPVMLQPVSSSNRTMKVGLTSDEMSLIEMSVLARWTIRPRLMGVPGVANVSIFGQRERQLQVQVDPQRLAENDVTLDQIISTTGNSLWVSPLTYLDASVPGTGGFIDTPNQRLTIQHISPITNAEELSRVVIEGTDKRLGDVANVVEDHQPLIGDAIVNDEPALMLVVEKFPGASTLKVTRGVEEALDALRPGLSGLEMDSTLFRPATFIENSMQNLTKALMVAAALIAVAIVIFLANWRCGLIGVVSIALSVLTAGLVLYITGTSLNMLVIAGMLIALGAVIDDSVTCMQNIVRRLRERRENLGSDERLSWMVREATVEMQGPLLYATVIMLLAVSPVIFMQGISSAFFQPMIYAYALALICSLVVALTVTPALTLMLFHRARLDADESPIAVGFRNTYNRIISPLLRTAGPATAVGVALVAAAILLIPQVRQESIFPQFRETNLLISLDAPLGTSHPAMSKMAAMVSRELRAIDGVKNVSGHIGRAICSDEVSDVNSCEMWVSLDPGVGYEATLEAIHQVVEGYPDYDCDVETQLGDRVIEEINGEGNGLVVRVYGNDLKVVCGKAEEVKRLLAKIGGVYSPEIEYPEEASRIEIEPDLEKCQANGIRPGDVRRQASVLLSGIGVGSLFDKQKIFDVVVWGTPEIRKDTSSVGGLLIDTPVNGVVALRELADVRVVVGPVVIQREAVARYVDVVAETRGRDLAAIGKDVKDGLTKIDYPLEYRAELMGQSAERMAIQQRIFAYAVAALIGIYLLLQAACGSWGLAALMLAMLPLSLVGGLVAVYLDNGLVSFGSLFGFLTVLSIAVRNGIVLVRRYQALALKSSARAVDPEHAQFRGGYWQEMPFDDERTVDGRITPEVVLQGTRERFVPIVLTALATALAFAPIVYYGNIAGLEILYPMAIVVLGGLVSATLVNLFVLPALYLFIKPVPEPDIVTEPIHMESRQEFSPA